MTIDIIPNLLGLQGFRIKGIHHRSSKGYSVALLDLERLPGELRCGTCGQTGVPKYDGTVQTVQHLPWWHHLTYLRFERYRVTCPTCGVRTEGLDFIDIRGPRVTKSLARHVYELCKVMTHKAVGILHGLHRGTVKAIDKACLEIVQEGRSLEGITVLGFDEIADGKGHNYLTIIHALEGPRGPECLMLVPGRKQKDLEPFWAWFGKERAKRITHGVMDMWKAFRNSLRVHCPKALVIYDKFHIISHLLDAVNEVRKQELKRLGSQIKGLLTGKKFILLTKGSRLRGKARQSLKELLVMSKRLAKAYLLKETFDHLWSFRSKTWARKFFYKWVAALKWSRLKPLQRFATMVEDHLDGILAYCDKKVPLGYIESSNQKARNVIRRAYGYRDKEFMRLKIIQGCTPWMNKFEPWRSDP